VALRKWSAVVQGLAGSIVLALLTFVCFQLRLSLATVVCLYLIVVVAVNPSTSKAAHAFNDASL
jgi:hypothetical protein